MKTARMLMITKPWLAVLQKSGDTKLNLLFGSIIKYAIPVNIENCHARSRIAQGVSPVAPLLTSVT